MMQRYELFSNRTNSRPSIPTYHCHSNRSSKKTHCEPTLDPLPESADSEQMGVNGIVKTDDGRGLGRASSHEAPFRKIKSVLNI